MKIEKFDQSMFLILKAAYLYYIAEKPQNQIANELGISITTVSRLLKRAKEEKVVEFVIRDPLVECIKMEEELRKALNVKDVIIAPAFSLEDNYEIVNNPENIKKLVALEGARYLQRIIQPGDVLGFTWGSTIYQMINYLNPAQKVEAEFVTLHGSLSNCENDWDVRTLVTRIAKAFSGTKYTLLTEALMSNKKTVEMLKNEKNIVQVYKMFNKVNVSINGIGSFYPEVTTILARPDYLPKEDLEMLLENNVVGDIALRFFDKDGNECDTSLKKRTISIGMEEFREIPTKVTIASGTHKAYPIMCAAKGRLIDVLIIDNHLGAELIKLTKEK